MNFCIDVPSSCGDMSMILLATARRCMPTCTQPIGVGTNDTSKCCVPGCLLDEMSDQTGCVAVVVDAKPAAVEFYQRYGFEAFEIISGALGDRPAPLPMILPLSSIPRE